MINIIFIFSGLCGNDNDACHIKLNNLEFVETTWGKYVTEPIHLKLELTDTVLERVYGVIEQMELNHSIFEKFKNSGNVMYNASLKIDNKLVINLKGGRDLMNNQVASNLMLLADHLRNLANGDEDEFMQWSGKIMDDTNQEKL